MATLNATTAPHGPQWVTVSAAARYLGEHRQQLQRMIRIGTFPRRYLDTSGAHPRILIAEGLARAVSGSKRIRFTG